MPGETDNKLEFKSVNMIMSSEYGYYIPAYQRGYRWTEQQVGDLLNDIYSFDNSDGSWYSLQPIVVRKCFENELDKKHKWYEVIDGQQRLTTLYLICHCYNLLLNGDIKAVPEPVFHYKTRKGFMDYLNSLSVGDNRVSEENIDYHYAKRVFDYIYEWFLEKDQDNGSSYGFQKASFMEKFRGSVKVIWYESVDENPIKVFTRLNVGKIPLTNSELIKALFLNKANFSSDEEIRLKQLQIANSWDEIERNLQNDEFWLFIHGKEYGKPTRIDFIFDTIKELDLLGVKNQLGSDEKFEKYIGNDDYTTFRYFSIFMGNDPEGRLNTCWNKVKETFLIFKEWYEDCELYHYIGFLIACYDVKVSDLLKQWFLFSNKTHMEFVDEYLISTIKRRIKARGLDNLDRQYKYDEADTDGIYYPDKTTCRPLLLLHNIQTVIDQNLMYKEKYESSVFNKFPFNLYKKESWDVEHIDPNTPNDFTEVKDQKEYLLNCFLAVDDDLRKRIIRFIESENKENLSAFNDIKTEIDLNLFGNYGEEESMDASEKNQIWNFVLLDSSTNRSYKNAIFSGKRRVIIGKDKGKQIQLPVMKINDNNRYVVEIEPEKVASSAFVAPVTKSVFLKYYTSYNTNPNKWTKADAQAYKDEIRRTLSRFIEED